TYVITGGMTGLGLAVAEWMCERGARHLALLGRRGLSADAEAAVARMEAAGARVRAVRVDVSHEADLATALAEISAWGPPLRGVIHCAGVLDDAPIASMDESRFRAVMAGKVHGAWNLHKLTLEKPLELFVLFSSMSALLGLPGQGNYAAANAFLDGLSQ